MAESVDRLELVADEEQPRIGPPERADQAELQGVGVLELVDQQVAELLAVALAHPLVAGQKRYGLQLKILEVEGRAGGLQALVVRPESRDQLAKLLVSVGHHHPRDGGPGALEGALVGHSLVLLEELAATLKLHRGEFLHQLHREVGSRVQYGGASDPLEVGEAQ